MKAHKVRKYKSVLKDGGLYQSKNPFIRWYFYKRLDAALKLSEISKDVVVLEVGSGEGFFVPSLISNADKVFACDINKTIIGEEHTYCYEWGRGKTLLSLGRELLAMELGEDASKRAMFFYADASRLPFKDNSLDLGKSYSVKEITEKIVQLYGKDVKINYKNERRKNEIMDTVAGIRKAKEKLGWEPSVDIDAGLKSMLDSCRMQSLRF